MDRDDRSRNDVGAAFRSAGPLLGAGIQLAASVLLLLFAGRWLDNRYGTAPWLMVTGIVLGFGAGLTSFIRMVNRLDDRKREPEK